MKKNRLGIWILIIGIAILCYAGFLQIDYLKKIEEYSLIPTPGTGSSGPLLPSNDSFPWMLGSGISIIILGTFIFLKSRKD